ncbi:MAG: hypothetical protein KAJ49_09290 [Arcobacteraceae bacterium]|nr:hypothetical protein [Arcobacteraceae bacterium]
MEKAIEYFSVFGGVKISVKIDLPIEEQIEDKIFAKYKYLRNDISEITMGDSSHHAVLSALASGDRRTNSAFRKVKVSFDDGIEVVDKQCSRGMLKLEKSRYALANQEFNESISEKLFFTTPFSHFWFAFVSPVFKGIRDGDFTEALKGYINNKSQFTQVVFNQLSHEVLKRTINQTTDRILNIGRYWDDKDSIDIIALTKDGKTIIGTTKFTNSKMKKSELTKLKELAKKLNIEVDTYVLFSKKGFSSELKSLKGENLKLFTPRNFAIISY